MEEKIIFRVDADLKQRVQALAALNERTVSQEIRHLLRALLDEEERQHATK